MTDLTKIKAILLDMDGTLIDTEALYKRSWQTCARELGFELSDHAYAQLIGTPMAKCLETINKRLPPHITPRMFYRHLTDTQNALKKLLPTPMKPGVDNLLKQLEQTGFPTAIVTSSTKKQVADNFANTPYENLFTCIVTCEDVNLYKPHPAPYLQACGHLELEPCHTLAIEDSAHGARSALDAGCHTIIVPDFETIPEDISQRAFSIFADLEQVTEQVIQPLLAGYEGQKDQ